MNTLKLVLVGLLAGTLAGCGGGGGESSQGIQYPPGMYVDDIVVGTGQIAFPGETLVVQYTGTLLDGTKFDSSVDRGQPFSFTLGAGQVIKGWDIGLQGMRVGGKRRLIIPPYLGYGANGSPPKIPPNATLVFIIDLVKI